MIKFEIINQFFDKRAVRDHVDAGTRRVLSKFGAFVRRTARSSIRKRKSISSPGSPPSSHIGLLKKFIYFGYDPTPRSVVIGPVRLSQNGRGEAPAVLEHGGPAKVGKRRAKYKPRPYMGPAFQKELPKLPAMWRDSIPRNK